MKYSFHPKIEWTSPDLLGELTGFLISLRDGPIAEWKKVRASQTEDQWAAYDLYLSEKDKEEFFECVLLAKAEERIREVMKMRPKLMKYSGKKNATINPET